MKIQQMNTYVCDIAGCTAELISWNGPPDFGWQLMADMVGTPVHLCPKHALPPFKTGEELAIWSDTKSRR